MSCLPIRGDRGQELLGVRRAANSDAHAFLGQETAAAPPSQRRVVADVGPMGDAKPAAFELDDTVLLRLGPGIPSIAQARPVRREIERAHGAGHPDRPGIKTEIAAHHADPVVAVPAKSLNEVYTQ